MSEYQLPCTVCDGSGMKSVDENWNRTCKHCFGSGLAYPIFDRARPHAIDHGAYSEGTLKPSAMLDLERSDPFWKTLGGNEVDPWGDGGETFRQRAKAMSLGIGGNVYGNMIHDASEAR